MVARAAPKSGVRCHRSHLRYSFKKRKAQNERTAVRFYVAQNDCSITTGIATGDSGRNRSNDARAATTDNKRKTGDSTMGGQRFSTFANPCPAFGSHLQFMDTFHTLNGVQ